MSCPANSHIRFNNELAWHRRSSELSYLFQCFSRVLVRENRVVAYRKLRGPPPWPFEIWDRGKQHGNGKRYTYRVSLFHWKLGRTGFTADSSMLLGYLGACYTRRHYKFPSPGTRRRGYRSKCFGSEGIASVPR